MKLIKINDTLGNKQDNNNFQTKLDRILGRSQISKMTNDETKELEVSLRFRKFQYALSMNKSKLSVIEVILMFYLF